MLKFLIISASLILGTQAAYSQDQSVPNRGGTLPLNELERGDGTLPLRMPSDGTLPLRLTGDAINQVAGSRVATTVTLTQAERRAMPASQAANLTCQTENANVSKHIAQGTVVVSGANFQIKGICYDHGSKQMEIVGNKGAGERSFMIGRLANPDLNAFSGSLIINGSTTVRYQFSVRSQGE